MRGVGVQRQTKMEKNKQYKPMNNYIYSKQPILLFTGGWGWGGTRLQPNINAPYNYQKEVLIMVKRFLETAEAQESLETNSLSSS